MVKYLGLAVAVALPLMLVSSAQAIGHHRGGCATCGGGYVATGGCPGGVCSVQYAAPGKMAVIGNAPAGLAVASAPAPVVTTSPTTPVVTAVPAQPAPNSYAMARRGLFGRRR